MLDWWIITVHVLSGVCVSSGDHFRFDSVFIKKNNQTNFFLNRNRFKATGFGSVWFFRTKVGSNQFGSVFLVWLDFFWFGSVFFWFFFCLGSVQFFRFQTYKTEPIGFFKILIGFFSRFDFFNYFF